MRLFKGTARILPHFRSGDFNTEPSGGAEAQRVEDTSLTTLTTYTTPAGQRARVAFLLSVLCEIAATSSTTTDKVGVVVEVIPEGQSVFLLARCKLNTVAMVAGDHVEVQGHVWVDAGDLIRTRIQFDGDAAGAGRVNIGQSLFIEEFNV